MLREMESDGLLTSTIHPGDNRPAKRCFALTVEGRACLDQWASTLQDYHAALCDLLHTVKSAMRSGRSSARVSNAHA